MLNLGIDLAVDVLSGLFLALVLNASFLLLDAKLGEVTVVIRAQIVHNFAELATVFQELFLDLVFEFARVSSVHFVCVHLRIVFFFGFGAQELQPHHLVLLKVLDRSIVLLLQSFVNLCYQVLLLLGGLEHALNVLISLRNRLRCGLLPSARVVLFVDSIELFAHLLHAHFKVIKSVC